MSLSDIQIRILTDAAGSLAAFGKVTASMYALRQAGAELNRIGQAGIGVMKDSTNQWADFEFSLNRAAGSLGIWETASPMYRDLQKSIQGVTSEVRVFPAEEIAKSVYFWGSTTGQVAKEHDDLAKIMSNLTPILKAAAVTETDVETAIKGVYSILVQYHRPLSDATDYTEKLMLVSQKTALEFPDLINAFKMVGPVAAANGATFEDMAVLMGRMGDAGIRGTMSGRAFRQMFIQLVRPTEKAQDALDDAFKSTAGLQKGFDAMVFPNGQFVGTTKYIAMLAKATEGMTQQEKNHFLSVISTANELPILTALIDQETAGIDKNKYSLAGAHDQFNKTFDLLAKSSKGTFGAVNAAISPIIFLIGKEFMSILQDLLPTIQKWAEAFKSWADANPGMIAIIARVVAIGSVLAVTLGTLLTFVATIGFLKIGLGAVLPNMGLFSKGAQGMGFALGMATGTLGPMQVAFAALSQVIKNFGGILNLIKAHPVIAAISAIMVIVGLLAVAWETNFMGIRDIAANVVSWLQANFGPTIDAIMKGVGAAVEVLSDVFDTVSRVVQDALSVVGDTMADVGSQLSDIAGQIGTVLSDIGAAVGPAISGVFDTVGSIIDTVVTSIGGAFTTIQTTVSGAFTALQGMVAGFVSAAAEALSPLAGLVQNVIDFFARLAQPILELVNNHGPKAASTIQGVADTITGVIGALASTFDTVFNQTIIPAIQNTVGVFLTEAGNIASTLGPLFDSVMNLLSAFGGLFGNILSVAGQLLGSFANLMGSTFNEISAIISGVLSVLGTLLGSFVNLMVNTFNEVAGLIGAALGVVMAVVGGFGDFIRNVIGIIVGVIQTIFWPVWDATVRIIAVALGIVGKIATEAFNFIMNNIIKPFATFAIQTFGSLFQAVSSIVQGGMQIVSAIIQGVIGVITGIFNAFAALLRGNWAALYEALASISSTVWNTITGVIRGAITAIGGIVKAGLDIIGNVFSTVFNGISTVVKTVIGAVQSAVTTGLNTVSTAFSNIITSIVTALTNLVGTARTIAGSIISGIVNAITGAIGNVANAIGQIVSTIVDTIGRVPAEAARIGGDIIQGIINGILGAGDQLARAVAGVVANNIPGPVRDLLGIHSPSRLMADIAKNIPLGMAVGIQDSAWRVSDAMERVAGRVVDIAADAGANASAHLNAATASAMGNVNSALSSTRVVRFEGEIQVTSPDGSVDRISASDLLGLVNRDNLVDALEYAASLNG